MRLLFVTETYPPEINGVAMTTGRMVEGLRDRGHWVGVVRPRQHDKDLDAAHEWTVTGIPIPNYSGLRIGLPAFRRLRRLMTEQRPELVHIVTEGPLGWSAWLAARRLGIPTTSGYHTHFDQYSAHYGLSWLTPLVSAWLDALHRRTHATLVPAPELAATLSARGIPNVRVVGRGVDTRLFTPARRSVELRSRWGAGVETLVCLYVGRLAPEKNLALTIRAFDAIKACVGSARMVWVGSGPSLKNMQATYADHIFAGPRMGEALAEHYASADLFLFGSLSETWGNVIGEAMASGLATVVFNRAAALQLIQSPRNGLAVPPGNDAAFILAAEELGTDHDMRDRIRAQAAADMREHAWERITHDFEAVVREVLEMTRKPGD